MSDHSSSLVRFEESTLAKIGKKIAITNKLLAISNDYKFIDFFLEHTELINIINRYYAFNEELLNKFQWNWYGLSSNPNLNWSVEFIEKYSNNWDWQGLSRNKEIKWTEDLILKFEEQEIITMSYFSNCEVLNWTEDLIDRYTEKQEWYWDWQALSGNPALPWSQIFFEKYIDKWDWSGDGLSSNPNLPWSIEFIEKYKTNWDWNNLSRNEGLPWSTELIENFLQEWDYLGLMENNGIPEDFNPVVKMINLKSEGRSGEFEDYSKKFKNIDYFIENYKRHDFEDVWDYLSGNSNINWTSEMLNYYRLNWGYKGLPSNKAIQWSMEFIEIHAHKVDFRQLCEKQIWDMAFKPYINENIVNEIMKRYKPN